MKRSALAYGPAGCGAGILVLVIAVAAGAQASAQGFDTGSVQGTYALVGTGGDHAAASIGTSVFDGQGKVRRSLLLNEADPASGQGRRTIAITSEGTYTVNGDGTGIARLTNKLPDGSTFDVTLDFVVRQAVVDEARGTKLATEIFSMEREPGIAAQLVTFSLHRLPD